MTYNRKSRNRRQRQLRPAPSYYAHYYAPTTPSSSESSATPFWEKLTLLLVNLIPISIGACQTGSFLLTIAAGLLFLIGVYIMVEKYFV